MSQRKASEDAAAAEQRPVRKARVPKGPAANGSEQQDTRQKRRKVRGTGKHACIAYMHAG